MMHLRRRSSSNNYTGGKVYCRNNEGRVINDLGSSKYIGKPSRQSKFWKVLEEGSRVRPLGALANCSDESYNKTAKENNMIHAGNVVIKKTTLIDGCDCDDVDLDTILNIIDSEELRIKRLQTTLAGSKNLTKRLKPHKDNIVALIKIIDARPVQ